MPRLPDARVHDRGRRLRPGPSPEILGRFLEADRKAFALRAARDRLVVPLARAARAFAGVRGWVPFGFARLSDFSKERLGRSSRWVRDLAALDAAFEVLPGLREAVTGEDGGRPLGRVSGLVVGRVATEASARAWIEEARRSTVRELVEAAREARAAGSARPPGPAQGSNGERAIGASTGDPPEEEPEEGPEERVLVSLLVPEHVRVAFDEVLDLHRAVEGTEATVTSFVEALVAERLATSGPPDVDPVSLRTVVAQEVAERALARSTRRWSHLDWSAAAREALATTSAVLDRARSLEERAGEGGPRELAEQLREGVALEDEVERSLGSLLAEMAEMGAWARLRFAGVGHYGEERLGLGRRTAEGRAALARALRRLPRLREAYRDGRVGLEAAALVVRAFGRLPVEHGIEAAWVARAEEVTIKRLRDEVRALARRACLGPRSEAMGPDRDDEWYGSLERRAGTARDRVGVLGRAAAAGPSADVFLRLRLHGEVARDFLASIEAARLERVRRSEEVPWWEPWPGEATAPGSLLAARAFSTRCRRAPGWVGLLALVEQYVETWDDPRGHPKREGDPVYVRAGWRCEAPACTSRRNLEDHHIVYRSRGGEIRDLGNRLCLCRFHHRLGEHGDLAACRGEAPLGVLWRLGRVDLGQWYRNERRMGPPD